MFASSMEMTQTRSPSYSNAGNVCSSSSMEMKQTTKVQDIQMHVRCASYMEMTQTTEVKDIQDLLDIVTYI